MATETKLMLLVDTSVSAQKTTTAKKKYNKIFQTQIRKYG
jgi:hypothetical protein